MVGHYCAVAVHDEAYGNSDSVSKAGRSAMSFNPVATIGLRYAVGDALALLFILSWMLPGFGFAVLLPGSEPRILGGEWLPAICVLCVLLLIEREPLRTIGLRALSPRLPNRADRGEEWKHVLRSLRLVAAVRGRACPELGFSRVILSLASTSNC